MAGKLAASVVSCRRGGASAAFERLNKYFTICNMHIVGSQYWNQVHGFTPDDVRQNGEGLQTMRTLTQNMAWLLRACLDLPANVFSANFAADCVKNPCNTYSIDCGLLPCRRQNYARKSAHVEILNRL